MTVIGTATDAGGGLVGGVEVSVDGGQTWHPATGRETWSYTFTPSAMGPTIIWSRAVDDSGNIEAGTTNVDAGGHPLSPTKSAGTAASVTVSEPICPCSIWPDSPTPGTPTLNDGALEVGVRFKADIKRVHHRIAVLQRGHEYRHAYRPSVDGVRDAAERSRVHR